MSRPTVWLLLVLCLCIPAAPALAQTVTSAPTPAKAGLILDETAYCRSYYQFGFERVASGPLKAEPPEGMTKQDLATLERGVKARLADKQIDWTKEDWRDHAVFRGFRMAGTGDVEKQRAARTDPPPEDWAKAEFDDAQWMRLKTPFAVGNNGNWHFCQFRCESPGLQAAFLRYVFQVPDPAAAGELTLDAVYVGGVRIFLNGKEITRSHLPSGAIIPETVADEYPLSAYRRLWTELSDAEKTRAAKQPEIKADTPPRYYGDVGSDIRADSRVYNERNRSLPVTKLSADLLRKGANVLAIEVRAAPLHPAMANEHWVGTQEEYPPGWLHAQLTRLSLRGNTGKVPSARARPAGVQVWAEDMNRRVFAPEHLELGAAPGKVRLVGARNGTYSAQVVVGADRNLEGVKVTAGALKAVGGTGEIPADCVRVMNMAGHPVGEMPRTLGQGRIPDGEAFYRGGVAPALLVPMARFAPDMADAKARQQAAAAVVYFDHITSTPCDKIAAGACQPYWLTVKVPDSAKPGQYAGLVHVEAAGAAQADLPVELEVADWRMPDPADFQVHMAVEQSPYGVAYQYGTEVAGKDGRKDRQPIPLWSEEHWKLIEASLAQLGRIGNDWFFVPVLLRTEFGNGDDSMIRWTRKADGSLAFDYSVMDRYLALVVKHCGRPRVISLVVMHGTPTSPIEVMVHDEASGKDERVDLGGPKADPEVRRKYWAAFGNDVYNHMKSLGLDDALHWGYAWDTEGDPDLKPLLRGVVPQVFWSSGSHNTKRGGSGGGGLDAAYFRSVSEIYSNLLGPRSRLGWKNLEVTLNTPRTESTAGCIEGHSSPFAYRLQADRALVAGYNGLGRIGGDYWAGSYYRGMRGSEYHMSGFPVLTVLWPGAGGAESSARFEALVEGIQETEARIFVEQALESGLLPEKLASRAQQVLFDHNRQTLSIPTHVTSYWMSENAQGWLGRSRRLYALAADVAGVIGMDTSKSSLRVLAEPYSRPNLSVKIRNWSAKPRSWKASSSEKWLLPEKLEGALAGVEPLRLAIDTSLLEPGATATGTLHVTDVASGAVHPVAVTVVVGKVFDFPSQITLNLEPGKPSTYDGSALFNSSAIELPFKIASSVPWITPQPAEGKLPAGKIVMVRLLCQAPASAGPVEAKLSVTVGQAKGGTDITAHLIPPYQAPAAPAGEPTWLNDALSSKAAKLTGFACAGFQAIPPAKGPEPPWWAKGPMFSGHNIPGGTRLHDVYDRDRSVIAYPMGSKTFQRGLWCFPRGEATFAIDGAGFTAFSAWVGFNKGMVDGAGRANRAAICACEVWVDGQFRASSGLFKVGDEPRLITADLAGAKEIRLLTRTASGASDPFTVVTWGDPALYRK